METEPDVPGGDSPVPQQSSLLGQRPPQGRGMQVWPVTQEAGPGAAQGGTRKPQS